MKILNLVKALYWEKPNLREKKSVLGGNSWNRNSSVMHQIEKHGWLLHKQKNSFHVLCHSNEASVQHQL
jgi:hypothetical protein